MDPIHSLFWAHVPVHESNHTTANHQLSKVKDIDGFRAEAGWARVGLVISNISVLMFADIPVF